MYRSNGDWPLLVGIFFFVTLLYYIVIMKPELFKILLLFFLLTISAAHAERYMGDSKDLSTINNLMNVLNVQQHELERLMNMLDRLEKWKKNLNQKNTKLAKEGELAKQDKKKVDNGEMSAEAINEKWHKSGRSLKHDHELKSFREEVVKFNVFVKNYNVLASKMSHILSKRSPGQVGSLINNMRKLIANLKAALNDGNIEKAKFIAKKSAIATEFGYMVN